VTDVQSENVTALWSCVRVCSSKDSCCLISMLADHNSVLNQSPAGLYSFSLSVRTRCLSLKSLRDRVSYMSKHAHTFMLSFSHLQITLTSKWKVLDPQTKKKKKDTMRSSLCQPCSTYLWDQHKILSKSE